MKTEIYLIGIVSVFFMLSAMLFIPKELRAHCDTLEGPVVKDARIALETGDINPILKWVRAQDELQIRSAFEKTLTVRKKGTEVQELADLYFFETLVRIHRAGEGAPYTGLKSPDTIDPAVKLADKALESNNADKLINVLTGAMTNGIRTRFQEATEGRKHMDESVEAGREFVKRYVLFTHYVEGLHKLIQGGVSHHHEGE